ncbi:MAG: DNA polymerase III subunit delta [Porphyromonadaceae bacterium]|nr:DNA polymerase III subunit delta [Porphyromonadaceae bacterium]
MAVTYDDVVGSVKRGMLRRVYLLMGDEPLFIDKLVDLFVMNVVPVEEQSLNQIVLYGLDVDAKTIVTEAMRFPMMGKRLLVLVREAHLVKDLDKIEPYLSSLPESTVLVLCYKRKVDKRKALYKTVEVVGMVYESQRIYDSKVPDFIVKSFSAEKLSIDLRTAYLMAEYTGNDLEKILLEIKKMAIALGDSTRVVTAEAIEKYIGISKEYNNFELLRALIERDATRAQRIAHYFAANEKAYPIQMTLSLLYNYFSSLMAVYYLSGSDERALAETLKVSTYQIKDYVLGAKNYSSAATYSIIRQIRLADAASKGVDSSVSDGEILRELLNFILISR